MKSTFFLCKSNTAGWRKCKFLRFTQGRKQAMRWIINKSVVVRGNNAPKVAKKPETTSDNFHASWSKNLNFTLPQGDSLICKKWHFEKHLLIYESARLKTHETLFGSTPNLCTLEGICRNTTSDQIDTLKSVRVHHLLNKV